MKNMKKLLQRAMVFTLSAAMLVGTPLTASAAPLNEVYKVTDSWGGTKEQNGDNDTRTGTVTSTETNSGALKADSKILGISLSETNVELEMDGAYNPNKKETANLTVSIDWDGEEDVDLAKKIMGGLVWRTGDRDIVALQALGKKDEVQLTAKAGGKTTVTVSLDSNEYNIHYTATANVTVEQWASKLSFSEDIKKDAYDGASLTLADYLVKDPGTATDKVTYVIKEDKAKAATLKNGVLTLKESTKKKSYKDAEVKVVAVGKKVKGEVTLKILEGVHATKVQIVEGTTDIGKKDDWLVNVKGDTREFGVKLTPDNCTDKVTWTSQKPGVVALESMDGGKKVKLTALSVGSSKITAKAGKKSAAVTITVRANLTSIDITTNSGDLYSGQTIQLTANQKFAAKGKDNFTDAGLNWYFYGEKADVNKMKQVATLNAKTGVLTIKPDVLTAKGIQTIKIKAQNAKAIGKNGDETKKPKKEINSNEVTFNLKQINVTSITVYSNMSTSTPIAGAELSGTGTKAAPKDLKKNFGKANTVNIANGTSRTYKVVVKADDGAENPKDLSDIAQKVLTWTSGKPALATAAAGDGKGTVSAIKKGKSTITVSSATKNGKGKYVAIKATFNANVTAPTKSITLSVKNPGIACKYGKSNAIAAQNVKVTAKLDKGTTSKTSEIKWSAVKVGDSTNTNLMKKDKKGNYTNTLALEAGKYAAGDKYIVTALLPGTGVRTNITLTIVEPTSKVQIVKEADKQPYAKNTETLTLGTKENLKLVTVLQKKGDSAWTVAGENKYATVTYTVKGDCVQLVGDEVIAIKAGKATITAKTSDGKTTKLTVKVQ